MFQERESGSVHDDNDEGRATHTDRIAFSRAAKKIQNC